MNYEQLKAFLSTKMRMAHIYQPVMIKHLLRNQGIGTDLEIAREISSEDPTQIEYYQKITNNMVGKVLRNHDIVDKQNRSYCLNGYEELTREQIKDLIDLCNDKLEQYITKRGEKIWQHRSHNREAIPGSIRYEVFKRAKFRCELCGCMDSERALEVDHIVPKNAKGEDSIHNYQALCYSCNATKRDHDDTDFRGVDQLYAHREENCAFCKIDANRVLEENSLAYLILDQYPVTSGHMLIIPKRHFPEYFSIHQTEINALHHLLLKGKEMALQKDTTIEGFNIGINNGKVAGQTIHHCHTHLIPRRKEDVENPAGGVRHIIPGKGYY